MKLSRILFLFLLVLTKPGFGQSARLDDFGVSKIDVNSVLVRWTMSKGSTCFRMEVQRSQDGLDFNTIYTYPGVCGDEDSARSYTWADANALAYSKSFYRLKLSEVEFSEVRLLDLDSDLAEQSFILFPNPCASNCKIKIRNPNLEEFEIRIFENSGRLVWRKKEIYGSETGFQLPGLKSGTYWVQIEMEGGSVLEAQALQVISD